MRVIARPLAAVGMVLLLASCASRSPLMPQLLPQATLPIELSSTPFFPQDEFQCGPAALATVLNGAGVDIRPEALTRQVYLPARRGSLQPELVAATRRAARIPYVIAPKLQSLYAELDAGRPVLVLQNLGLSLLPVWHYAVVIGTEPHSDQVVLRSGTIRRHSMTTRAFLRSWQLADHWAMVVLRPGELPTDVDRARFLQALATTERYLPSADSAAAYRAALQYWPGDPVAQFGLAFARHRAGDLAGATRAYRALIQAQKDHAPAYNNLADVLSAQGCYVAARTAATRALAIARRTRLGVVDKIQATLDEIPNGADTGRCDDPLPEIDQQAPDR